MNNDQNVNSGHEPASVEIPSPKQSGGNPLGVALAGVTLFVAVVAVAGVFIINDKLSETSSQLQSVQSDFKRLDETANAAKTNNEDEVNEAGYQAVFLDSGQVYFGRITAISNTQITLTNIYYLRVGAEITKDNINDLPEGSDISLVKLGDELHGPEDTMYIERKETAFWENLKEDSQVVKAIKEFEKANPR